jgi:hypothetical protein
MKFPPILKTFNTRSPYLANKEEDPDKKKSARFEPVEVRFPIPTNQPASNPNRSNTLNQKPLQMEAPPAGLPGSLINIVL